MGLLEIFEILQIPDIIVVIITLPAPDRCVIQRYCNFFSNFLIRELDPTYNTYRKKFSGRVLNIRSNHLREIAWIHCHLGLFAFFEPVHLEVGPSNFQIMNLNTRTDPLPPETIW